PARRATAYRSRIEILRLRIDDVSEIRRRRVELRPREDPARHARRGPGDDRLAAPLVEGAAVADLLRAEDACGVRNVESDVDRPGGDSRYRDVEPAKARFEIGWELVGLDVGAGGPREI